MPNTLQYPRHAVKQPYHNYDIVSWGVAAANPGTTASVTVQINRDTFNAGVVLIGIVGQTGVTYTITSPVGHNSSPVAVSRDGAGTHAEIRYDNLTLADGPTTFTVTASSSVKFGIIVITFNGPLVLASVQLDKFDSNVDGTGTSHVSGATGFTTNGSGSFTLALGCPSSDPGAITYDPNYNGLPSANGLVVFQCASRDAPNSLVSTQASFTTANSVTECTNVMATFAIRATPSQFVQAIQQQQQNTYLPPVRPDPGWFAFYPNPIVNVSVPKWGFMPQFVDITTPIRPAFGTFSEQVDPTLYVKQNLGWLHQQPDAPPLTKVPDPGWYAHNLSPIINVAVPSFGWYVQQPQATPQVKLPDAGWFTHNLKPIITVPVVWGWYVPSTEVGAPRKTPPQWCYVMPTQLFQHNFDGVANVFDVHLVTPAVTNVNLIVPVTTSTTLQNP